MGTDRSFAASSIINRARSFFQAVGLGTGMSMSIKIELKVHLARDDETGIWYVAETDIPGLRLESASAAGLIEKIQHAAPEMIELNCEEIIANGTLKDAGIDKAF